MVWFGEMSRINLRCFIPSAAGATKARKSEGVIQGGTASTATIVDSCVSSLCAPSDEGPASLCAALEVDGDEGSACRALLRSRNIRTMPSGKLVDPELDAILGMNVATGVSNVRRVPSTLHVLKTERTYSILLEMKVSYYSYFVSVRS